MANLTEHVIINKLNKDINTAILAVGGDTTNADGLPHYSQVIRDQLISKNVAGVISFKGVFDSLEEVDNPTKGDFVIVGEIEYVYFDKWIELGNATAAMSAIQNLRNQCVLKTDKGVDITTTSSGLQYSFQNDRMIIGKPDPQSPTGFNQTHTLMYDGGNFTIGTHRVSNNDSSQIGKYYLDFYDDDGLQIGTSSYNSTSPCLRYNDNGLWVKHGGGDLTLRDGQFFLNLINLGSSTYDFNSDYFRITREENGANHEILQKGGQLIIGTEQQFNYNNTGESTFTMLDRDGIKFSKIGTKVGSIGNDRYAEYAPVRIGKGGLIFTTFNKQSGSTVVHGMNADGLTHRLQFKYKDRNNNLQTSDYKASYPIGTITNCFDITDGIYYATTCNTSNTANTAERVKNDLIIHTPNGDVRYNGSQAAEVSVGSSNDGPSIGGGMVEVTYGALKSLRDNDELVPGTKYKITDYETIISGQNVAYNKFDIIVTALSNNTLSESASAAINENDLLFEASRNIFSWSDINNWDNVNTSDIPQEIVNLSPKAVAKQQGTRTVNGGEVVRVSIVGYTGDYQNPAVQEDVKGLGASLYTKSDNTLIASDYGYDKDVYYLRVPESIAANTDMIIQFYIDSDATIASNGICGATADAGRLLPHPSISYFSDSNLSAWEIKYSLDNDGGRYLWANPDGKGVIYYMKDEYGNEASYDFKNIKYGDHYTFDYLIDNVHYDGSVKYGRYCHHNKIDLDINGYGDKGLPNVCFKNTTNNAECSHNIISEDCWNIKFGSGCHHNEISNGCESLTFGDNCSYNILENHCSRNGFGSQCSYNTFGHDSCDNSFGDYVIQCSFGCRCSSCKFTYSDNTTASYVKSFHLPEDCNSLVIQQTQDNSNANSYLQYYKMLNPISNKTIGLNPVVYKNETLSHNNRSYYTFLTGEDQIINNTVVEQIIPPIVNGIRYEYEDGTLTLSADGSNSISQSTADIIKTKI